MLDLCPITRDEANAFVAAHHRHHGPVVSHKFSIGLARDSEICGVVIVGRPVARHNDDGLTLEVTRLATDGTKNACSMLYGAAWRAAKALGYKRMITYTLATEDGASLRAAGWKELYKTRARSWSTPTRPRVDKHPTQHKALLGGSMTVRVGEVRAYIQSAGVPMRVMEVIDGMVAARPVGIPNAETIHYYAEDFERWYPTVVPA